ncbi:MAG: 7-carboxy-7-deazaguanine synthase [Dehalococcoidia bacterium]|nr:7-carboxy-7-deazaguanine synthase [Bacillota bacterium]
MRVVEIFNSIQGEGAYTGYAASFVRLAGCNLRCHWCDTRESWDLSNGYELETIEIANICLRRIVIITGGEPLLHDLAPLVTILHDRGQRVHLETNGTLPLPDGINLDWVTVSPKFLSGYALKPQIVNEVKLVMDDHVNDRLIAHLLKCYSLVYLQPESMNPQSISRCLEFIDKYPELKLSLQIHKILNIK